jgi:hypothetical protein
LSVPSLPSLLRIVRVLSGVGVSSHHILAARAERDMLSAKLVMVFVINITLALSCGWPPDSRPKPPEITFTADKVEVPVHAPVILKWRTKHADQVEIIGRWADKTHKQTDGSTVLRPQSEGSYIYYAIASGRGGKVQAQLTITVR